MTEVLSIPRKPDGQSYYSDSPLKRSSHSYSSFLSGTPSYSANQSSPPSHSTQHQTSDRTSRSVPSSATTSARQSFTDLSQVPSFSSTPASSVSFDTGDDEDDDDDDEDDDDEIAFPSYDGGVKFYHDDEPLDLPPSPKVEKFEEDEAGGSQDTTSCTTDSTRSESPLPTPTVADDTAVKQNPSRHVDYLSHDWREEDIWSSWRHIVSQRKVYGQWSRLENASWRTWAKAKHHLATISPETLNWLKESDVTWLYGPLQPAMTHPVTHRSSESSPHHLSSSSSFTTKKPILKKRSMSEVMLQRSISASSLIKQAAAAVQAQQSTLRQQNPRPVFARAASDFAPSNPISRDQLDYFTSWAGSEGDTPADCHKRHIRFDDKVEQCIAVDCKEEEHEYDSDPEMHLHDSDSDSDDDGVVMMRRPRRKRPTMAGKNGARSQTPVGKIIEKLPDTTLKYKVDSPSASAPPLAPFARSTSSSKLSQSASSETLRPSHPSTNFLLPQTDGETTEETDSDPAWNDNGIFNSRRDSVAVARARAQGKYIIDPDEDDDEDGRGPSGLRRTPSGMFMPYEEDEDDVMAAELGLLGKVNETINTAKDIAHVIWNVGWRK